MGTETLLLGVFRMPSGVAPVGRLPQARRLVQLHRRVVVWTPCSGCSVVLTVLICLLPLV